MKGTQGGVTAAMSCRYFVKFLLLSIVISHAPNCAMYRCPTCSQVRLRRLIGGVLSPDVIAIILEKLFRVRQRCEKRKRGKYRRSRRESDISTTYISHANQVLDNRCTPLRIFFAQDQVRNPIRNLRDGGLDRIREPFITRNHTPYC
jgi:stalled ribosome alternative rescue factor ArfA